MPDHHDFDAWVEQLATPHRARRAYWHLVLSPSALPAVRRGLEHSDPEVRSYCCKVLDHIADETSFGLLVEMLGDEDAVTRRDALHALACDRCKTDVCTPSKAELLPLAARMLREDPDKYVRGMAAEVVGKWVHTDDEAAAVLIVARDADPEPSVRKKAGWYAPGGTIYRKTAPRVTRGAAPV